MKKKVVQVASSSSGASKDQSGGGKKGDKKGGIDDDASAQLAGNPRKAFSTALDNIWIDLSSSGKLATKILKFFSFCRYLAP